MTDRCRENEAGTRLGDIAARLPLAAALLAALALASCGGDDDAQLLPGSTAREITANLDAVQQLADAGECAGAEEAAAQVGAQVEALQGVEPELKRALERGAARLSEVVDTCEEPEAEEPAATVPDPAEPADEDDDKRREAQEKQREKEEKRAEKEEEKEAEKEAEEEEEQDGPPDEVPPPQSNGQGEGPPGEGSEEASSGGISPGSAVGGGD